MNNPKAQLRIQLRQNYSTLNNEYMQQADNDILQRVNLFSLYQSCHRVFLFASAGNEVDTHRLIQQAYGAGKNVYLPKCSPRGIMEFYQYFGELRVGRFGIMEPVSEQKGIPDASDLMIVPGLAFTHKGLRLGQGGGYYDRYLEQHPCVTLGLCRDTFLINDIPTEWNDLPVDYVITEKATYECKNGAS